MKRRSVLRAGLVGSVAALLPRFAIGQSANARVLRFVPQANLTVLDPIVTTDRRLPMRRTMAPNSSPGRAMSHRYQAATAHNRLYNKFTPLRRADGRPAVDRVKNGNCIRRDLYSVSVAGILPLGNKQKSVWHGEQWRVV